MKGEEFLNKLYRDLNLSDEVTHTSKGAKDKDEAVKRYMDRLETVHNKVTNEHKLDLLKRFYYKKYIVKELDIPRYRDKEKIINAQKESLDKWLNYLLDENTRYPMWAKYWAFQGMLKIGNYNEATGTYQKRSKKTLAPFIEVNPEVLAKCIGMVVSYVEKDELNEQNLDKLVESGNFQKLYTILLKDHKKDLVDLNNNELGIWITYNYETEYDVEKKEKRGIEPEYLKLYKSLQGYNTGWCTAGDKETAKHQICGTGGYVGGDFYVYYTKDKNNEYKVPRIAIRMEDGYIGEIRGVEDGQNLEEGLEEIVENKLYDLNLVADEIEESLEKVSNMKRLTKLMKKDKNKEEFTEEDIVFIYQLEEEIEGFGYDDDPRIEEIIENRDVFEDFQKLRDIKYKIAMVLKFSDDIFDAFDKLDDKELLSYREIVLEAVKRDGSILEYASEYFRSDREFILEAVKQNGGALEYASEELQSDREIVLEAVKQDYFVLSYASEEFLSDREFILEAVKQNGGALEYASEELQSDREIVLEAVKCNGRALEYASEELQSDREIVLEAVKQNGMSLRNASKELQSDREIVLEAVKQNGMIFKYASKELQSDREIVLEAVKQDFRAIYFAGEDFISNRETILEAVKQNGMIFKYASEELQSDREIVLEAVKQNGMALRYAIKFKHDREIVLEAVKQNGEALRYSSEELKFDQSFLLKALELNGEAIEYVSPLIVDNKFFMYKALSKNLSIFKYVPELRKDDNLIFSLTKKNGLALAYGSKRIRSNKSVVLLALSSNVTVLKYIPPELFKDREFMLEVIKQNPKSLKYIPKDIGFYDELLIVAEQEREKANRKR